MRSLFDRALLGLHIIGAMLLAALTAVICYDVLGRLLFNQPFAGTSELAGVGLVLITFLQAPYVIRERKLLRVTFFVDRMPARVCSLFNAFAYLVGFAFFLTLLLASWEPALSGFESGEFYGTDAFRIPAWPLRFGTLMLWIVAAAVCLGYVAEGLRGRLSQTKAQLPD